MTGVLLQVRLDSSRLPGKALLPIEGKPVIQHAMEALKTVKADVHAVVTDKSSSEALKPLVKVCGFKLYVGPKEDVLARFIGAAGFFTLSTIVRATGDNPLVSSELANILLEIYQTENESFDYLAFDGPPIGTGVEIVNARALEDAGLKANDSYSREHVCPFLYQNPDIYKIKRLKAPNEYCLPEEKVTLDTPEDFSRLLRIYADLYNGSPIQIKTLIEYLDTESAGTASITIDESLDNDANNGFSGL